MATTTQVQQLLERSSAVLPVTDEDIIWRGITTEIVERIVQLKKARVALEQKYGSLESLKQRIGQQGVSVDDHAFYTDLLEWKAINHELSETIGILESM
ncbi:hypothetical protein KJ693_10105 [bacterium]|nr:hypothetical protein [bacterium]MBU1615642.1 hypothetical protein [bacterium]